MDLKFSSHKLFVTNLYLLGYNYIFIAVLLNVYSVESAPVTLFLHEEINFKGASHEFSLNHHCQPIPVSFINKIKSIRAEGCVILYENDGCERYSGSTLRLSPTAPTRANLIEQNFSLGSAQPCSVNSHGQQSYGPIPIPVPSAEEEDIDYKDDNLKLEPESIQNQDSDKNGEKFLQVTKRSRGYGFFESDYGERIDTDNEPDEDFRNHEYFDASSQRSAPLALDKFEEISVPRPESPIKNINATRGVYNNGSSLNSEPTLDEVPLLQPEPVVEFDLGDTYIANVNFTQETFNVTRQTTLTPEETTLLKYDELLARNGTQNGFPEEFEDVFTELTQSQKSTTNSSSLTFTPTQTTVNTNPAAEITPRLPAPSPTSPLQTTTKFQLTTPGNPCKLETLCKETDSYGSEWEVCPLLRGTLNCPGNGSTGIMSWECDIYSNFIGMQPNFDNCTSEWVRQLGLALSNKVGEGNISNPPFQPESILSNVLQNIINDETSMDDSSKYFGHEISLIANLVESTVNKSYLIVNNFQEYENVSEQAVNVFKTLLSKRDEWNQLNQTNKAQVATEVLDSVEASMFNLGKVASVFNKASSSAGSGPYEKVFKDSDDSLQIVAGYLTKNDLIQNKNILVNSLQVLQTGIELPKNWEYGINGETIRFVGLKLGSNYAAQFFPAERNLFGSNSALLGSEIVGVSLANESSDKAAKIQFPGDGIKILFDISESESNIRTRTALSGNSQQQSDKYWQPVCVFWDPNHLKWSTDGCHLVTSDYNNAVCECQHLTLFAVLMDAHGFTNYVKDAGLYMVTIALCTLSSVCLLITIIVLKVLHSAQSPSTSITIQLCLCLFIANILIMTVLDRNTFKLNEMACSIAAISIHYTLLSAFTWMAIEGYVVLKMVLDVFDTGTGNKILLSIVGYGFPLLVVTTLSAIHFLGIHSVYGGGNFCWLQGIYLLAFIIPVILVVLGNGVALAVAIRVAYKVDRRYTDIKKKVKSFRTWIIGTLALTSILGLTWIFGLLLLIGDKKFARIASYVFTIFNASQGIFVFIFHCVLNQKVRAAFRSRFTSTTKFSIESRSTGDSHGKSKPSNNAKNTNSSNNSNNQKRRLTQLTSIGTENEDEKKQIKVQVEKDDSDPEEAEARRRFLRSRSDSDDLSRKPAFYKYLEQNPGRKNSTDIAFM